jgi:hypothetical protein
MQEEVTPIQITPKSQFPPAPLQEEFEPSAMSPGSAPPTPVIVPPTPASARDSSKEVRVFEFIVFYYDTCF